MPAPEILVYPESEYISRISLQIAERIKRLINEQGCCSVMLTGGRTAEALYRYWSTRRLWDHARVTYYFGDERCVPPEDKESNFGMVVSSLFPNGIPEGCQIKRMQGEVIERNREVERYAVELPDAIDLLLLSVGPDGHIASLFPESSALEETEKSVVPTMGAKKPNQRLTVTPKVLRAANSILLFITGREKGEVVAKALGSDDHSQYPVLLVKDRTWLMDDKAAIAMQGR